MSQARIRKVYGFQRQLLRNQWRKSRKVKRLADRCSGWWYGVYENSHTWREQPYRAVRLKTMLHGPNPNGTPANSWGDASPLYALREILFSARHGMPGQIAQLF